MRTPVSVRSLVATLCLLSPLALASSEDYTNLLRQIQQGETNVSWDMPVSPNGTRPAALLTEEDGSLFQLWTISRKTAEEYLLDQKLVGAYLPKGVVTIHTLDSYNGIPRIRVDQPFSVDFTVSKLLGGPNFPIAATKVLAQHHLAPNLDGTSVITPARAISGAPFSSGFITRNGITTVEYAASAITAPDLRKGRGEEHFVLHALSDGTHTQTQIATAGLQVWPVATGTISGISENELLRGTPPALTVAVRDLYPSSSTQVRIYSKGPDIGEEGKALPGSELILDQALPENRILIVEEYGELFDSDGPYRVDLLTTTPFGTERLDSVNFQVNRSLRVNAMQVDAKLSTMIPRPRKSAGTYSISLRIGIMLEYSKPCFRKNS